MVDESDWGLIRWSREHNEAVEQTNSSSTYGRTDPATKERMKGWCGLEATSKNNKWGEAACQIDARPVLDGKIELSVRLTKQAPTSTRSQSKQAFLYLRPKRSGNSRWRSCKLRMKRTASVVVPGLFRSHSATCPAPSCIRR